MKALLQKKGFICDMDGVIYHGDRLLPRVREFVDWLYAEKKEFLFLTNNSAKTQRELQAKLSRMGWTLTRSTFTPVPLATAEFVAHQKPGARAFVIGEPGLLQRFHEQASLIDETDPDLPASLVVGESRNYTYDSICRAARCVNNGARLIGTNTDLTAPTEWGQVPCRALVCSSSWGCTGKEAYYVGKPNPLMMRTGLNLLGVHSQDTAIIGDRMDTDIVAGIECGLDTVLVLSGVTDREDRATLPYRLGTVAEPGGGHPRRRGPGPQGPGAAGKRRRLKKNRTNRAAIPWDRSAVLLTE